MTTLTRRQPPPPQHDRRLALRVYNGSEFVTIATYPTSRLDLIQQDTDRLVEHGYITERAVVGRDGTTTVAGHASHPEVVYIWRDRDEDRKVIDR